MGVSSEALSAQEIQTINKLFRSIGTMPPQQALAHCGSRVIWEVGRNHLALSVGVEALPPREVWAFTAAAIVFQVKETAPFCICIIITIFC